MSKNYMHRKIIEKISLCCILFLSYCCVRVSMSCVVRVSPRYLIKVLFMLSMDQLPLFGCFSRALILG